MVAVLTFSQNLAYCDGRNVQALFIDEAFYGNSLRGRHLGKGFNCESQMEALHNTLKESIFLQVMEH